MNAFIVLIFGATNAAIDLEEYEIKDKEPYKFTYTLARSNF